MHEESKNMQQKAAIRMAIDKAYRKKQCLHPDAPDKCKGQIVRAHTVQRSMLKKIASKNHVLTPKAGLYTNNYSSFMERKGTKQASTFTGFCSYHDNELFAPIENRPFVLNEHNALLLAYRCLSKELYNKQRNTEIDTSSLITHGADISRVAEYERRFQAGTRLALQKDIKVFEEMGDAIVSRGHHTSYYCAFELDTVPGILCGGVTNVNYDFNHVKLQDTGQTEPLDLITLSLLPFNERGIAVFAWYGTSTVNERLVKSLISYRDSEIPDAIVRLVFQYFENFFVSPTWWNRLSKGQQESLAERFESTFNLSMVPVEDIRPDGFNYVKWKVVGTRTNLKV